MTARFEDMFRDIMDAQSFWFPVFGEIKTFNAAQGTVDVLPKVALNGEGSPVLKGIPLLLPGGGGWLIDFQPAPGDFALLIFCGQNVFQFWNRSKTANVENKPSLMDAVAIPFSKRTSSAGVTIKNESGTVKVEVTDIGVKMTSGAMSLEVAAADIKTGTQVSIPFHTHTVVVGGATLTTSVPTPS